MKRIARTAAVLAALAAGAALYVYFARPDVLLALAERVELRAAGLQRREAQIGGDHVVYLEGGQGPIVLLLHGFGADKSNWVRVARDLTPHFRVLAPDLPGFGESTRDPDARYAVADQVERVHAFTQALGSGKLCIGGNSMGGAIAGAFAARYPGEVECLWMIAPGFVRGAKPSELQERMARGENPLLVEDPAGFERLLDLVFVERPSIPAPILRELTAQAIAHRSFNEKVMKDLFAAPIALEDVVRGLSVPTLVTWGDHDRLVDVSGARVLGAAIPGARLDIVPNVGHVPMVERPEQAARAFLAFRGLS